MTHVTKLQKIFHFGSLTVGRAFHRKFEETLPEPQFEMVDNSSLLGLEIEVEGMHNKMPPMPYYWKVTKDGSLRNNGIECVSIPLRANQVEYALTYLNTMMTLDNDPQFSTRTSVHVHLNVRDLTWDQVSCMVLLYAIFERHFFNLVGTRREESIFCVPLYKTGQLTLLRDLSACLKWHKYNALNLACIYGDGDVKSYGTIEFRHLYGTSDTKTIIDWINNILILKRFAIKQNFEDLKERLVEMNTSSEYIALYQEIFQQYAQIRTLVKHDFEYCISTTKLALFGDAWSKKVPPHPDSPLAKFLGWKPKPTLQHKLKYKDGKLVGVEVVENNEPVKELVTDWKYLKPVGGN